MTKNEFIELVIAYGANGTAETETYTERQQGIVAQAWAALIHAEESYGNEDSEEYCQEAEEAAEAYFDDFNNAQEVKMKKYVLTITAGAPAYYLNAISTIAGALMSNGGYNSERNNNGTYTITYDSEEELKESIKAAAEEINEEHGVGSASFDDCSIFYDSAYSELEIANE